MLPAHPAAAIFPLLEGQAFTELVEDVRRRGLVDPIVTFGDTILDGRNRARACEEAGTEPRFTEYTGDDPLGFVVSTNLHRRHLTESQRAMVGTRVADLQRGANQHTPIGGTSQADAAALLNVSERAIQRAAVVQREAVPELIAAVDRGDVAVSTAADVAKLPQAEQVEIVAKGEREILETAKRIRAERADARRTERVTRIDEYQRALHRQRADKRAAARAKYAAIRVVELRAARAMFVGRVG